ncbi:TetR/AcrR family transcriptional regulator C-terminal ligand-binding domain-containing protein [Streptosporangium sp. DT93]|uniref:TetR/AcrR family transcriptional regulator C-terminal ligand-binding domain-containing protein n=1 Tax=Streptosporangium sp. DT93 TaxID=3393428 RepID=UPI003CF2E93A
MPAIVSQTYRMVRVTDLEPHAGNPHQGDVDVIAASIEKNGFYGTILVQASRMRIIAGEHRRRGAKARAGPGARPDPRRERRHRAAHPPRTTASQRSAATTTRPLTPLSATAAEPGADTADLRRDLRAHAREITRFLTGSDAGAVFRALTAQAQHDPALAARLRFEHLGRQRGHDRLPFERAVARGALDPGVDVDLAVDQIVGPIYCRVLVTGQSPTPEFTDALVDVSSAGTPRAERP